MSSFWLILAITIAVVGFFVLGMSLTLIFKGHHIDSEIGDNENMKNLGIECASRQIRNEERGISGDDGLGSCSHSCGSCIEHECVDEAHKQK